jgi:hypothetical protein
MAVAVGHPWYSALAVLVSAFAGGLSVTIFALTRPFRVQPEGSVSREIRVYVGPLADGRGWLYDSGWTRLRDGTAHGVGWHYDSRENLLLFAEPIYALQARTLGGRVESR